MKYLPTDQQVGFIILVGYKTVLLKTNFKNKILSKNKNNIYHCTLKQKTHIDYLNIKK